MVGQLLDYGYEIWLTAITAIFNAKAKGVRLKV